MKGKSSGIWPQYLLAVICNIGMFTYGLHGGWLAPLHPHLTSDSSPLGDDVLGFTTEEISWIAAMPTVSVLVATPVYGVLLQRIGRRLSSLFAVLPNIAAFVILMFSKSAPVIYLARFIAGFGSCGSLIVTPVFVNESVNDDVRGFLCGMSSFFVNAGVVVATAAGGYLPYRLFNGLCLSFSLVYVAFHPWLPETPVYSVMKGRTAEAVASMRKLRRCKSWDAEAEVKRIEGQLSCSESGYRSVGSVLSDGMFRRSLFLALGVMTTHKLCGSGAVVSYSVKVFEECGSSLLPVLASTVITCALLVGSVAGSLLMDKVGRKILLIAALSTMSLSLTVLWTFLFIGDDATLGWLSPIALSLYTGVFSCGLGSVSFVIVTELFPPDVRGISGPLCIMWTSVLSFIMLKFFPVLVAEYSIEPVFLAFAVFCAAGIVFVRCFIIETKGKSPYEITQLLKNKNNEVAESVAHREAEDKSDSRT